MLVLEIGVQVKRIEVGVISTGGTAFGGFTKVGTSSAMTTVIVEYAPNPTPFFARALNC